MARQFGDYSPEVPLGVTWEEPLWMSDERGQPVDLTGLHVRAQLRAELPIGASPADPILEITTAGYYDTAPAWPVFEAFTVPEPEAGQILLSFDPADFAALVSPTNAKVKLRWEIVLVNKDTGVIVPVVAGKVVFLPAVTR